MIPLDIEEIFGSSILEAVRRGAVFFACLLVASTLATFSLGAGEAIVELDLGECYDWLEWWYFAWMLPVGSPWALLFVPVVIASAYWFFASDRALPRPFLEFVAAESLLIVLAVPDWEWSRGVAFIVLGGCLMALRHLAAVLSNRLRINFERRMMALAAANERRRAELHARFGTEMPDWNATANRRE